MVAALLACAVLSTLNHKYREHFLDQPAPTYLEYQRLTHLNGVADSMPKASIACGSSVSMDASVQDIIKKSSAIGDKFADQIMPMRAIRQDIFRNPGCQSLNFNHTPQNPNDSIVHIDMQDYRLSKACMSVTIAAVQLTKGSNNRVTVQLKDSEQVKALLLLRPFQLAFTINGSNTILYNVERSGLAFHTNLHLPGIGRYQDRVSAIQLVESPETKAYYPYPGLLKLQQLQAKPNQKAHVTAYYLDIVAEGTDTAVRAVSSNSSNTTIPMYSPNVVDNFNQKLDTAVYNATSNPAITFGLTLRVASAAKAKLLSGWRSLFAAGQRGLGSSCGNARGFLFMETMPGTFMQSGITATPQTTC
eukprot:jgi/Chrzof1/11481/UNPLg00413.t1